MYVYVPGTVLGAGDTAENKLAQVAQLWSLSDATATAIPLPLCHSSPFVSTVRAQGSWSDSLCFPMLLS